METRHRQQNNNNKSVPLRGGVDAARGERGKREEGFRGDHRVQPVAPFLLDPAPSRGRHRRHAVTRGDVLRDEHGRRRGRRPAHQQLPPGRSVPPRQLRELLGQRQARVCVRVVLRPRPPRRSQRAHPQHGVVKQGRHGAEVVADRGGAAGGGGQHQRPLDGRLPQHVHLRSRRWWWSWWRRGGVCRGPRGRRPVHAREREGRVFEQGDRVHFHGQRQVGGIHRPRQHRHRQQRVRHSEAVHGGVPQGVEVRGVESVALPEQLFDQRRDRVVGVKRLGKGNAPRTKREMCKWGPKKY